MVKAGASSEVLQSKAKELGVVGVIQMPTDEPSLLSTPKLDSSSGWYPGTFLLLNWDGTVAELTVADSGEKVDPNFISGSVRSMVMVKV